MSMHYIDLGEQKEIISGLDSVVIRNYLDGIKGGKVLDVQSFTGNIIKTGHVIIVKDGIYKPMPLNGGGTAYASLPADHSYVGICMTTTTPAEPVVGILTAGEVNDAAVPFSMASIMSAFKAACPNIRFDHD